MSNSELEAFAAKFEGFVEWGGRKQVDYFAYFLTGLKGQSSVTAGQIEDCFSELSLKKYSRIAAYLSEEAKKSRGGKYIKHKDGGYRLERGLFNELEQQSERQPKKIEVSKQLLDVLAGVRDHHEKSFLEEAIKCFKVESFRATIIMVWLLTVDHLQKYVFGDATRLAGFNKALSLTPDKRVTKIARYDDFSDLKEEKFVELLRSSNIISNDVRKILLEKLGIRNTAAHPSAIIIDSHKATEFVSDLVNNVVLKY